jgi:hypothetical protein
VDEADQHPLRHQIASAPRDLLQQRGVRVLRRLQRRIVAVQHVVRERAHALLVAVAGEVFERAHADVAGRDAGDHAARADVLADHPLAGGDHGERAGRGHAERRHRLAPQILRDHREQRRAAVAHARERRLARALELDVALDAVAVGQLAQQHGAAVAQLWHPVAELMPGVGLRDRIGAFGHAVAGEHLQRLVRLQLRGVEAQLAGQRRVYAQELRVAHLGRLHPGVKALRQAGVAGLEAEDVRRIVTARLGFGGGVGGRGVAGRHGLRAFP